MAVAVPLTVGKLARFKTTTFGMRARCESLNSKCDHEGMTRLANCSSLGITTIPNQDGTIMSAALVAPVHKWDGAPISSSDAIMREGIVECCATNPISSILQLRWSTQNSAGYSAPNAAVDTYPFSTMTVLASCSVEVFNVTLRYDGTAGPKAWALDLDETVLSEPRFATALIAPYSWQMVTDRLTMGIRARAVTARTVDVVMASLNQELAGLALGFVSGSFVFAPAENVHIFTPTILGRYPLAPLLAFTGLLALYGFIALVVFAMSTTATSSLIHVPSELRGKPQDKAIPELKLAQIRLLNPLPVVAQHFGQYQSPKPGPDDPDARSVKPSAPDMFPESETRAGQEMRLRLGLESGSARPRYGVWKNE